MKKRTALIIHGHFYQPPRENPWSEEIEREQSADPFDNWNERIYSQCYRSNAHSRVIGEYGRVKTLSNNYAKLSFNFGPTLFSWLNKEHSATAAAIVTADQESLVRLGHGNAIAQAYNHVILPLADERDLETQIVWGLADFRKRFHREAEAMWLPETAADLKTLAELKKHGMKYAILSPFQAAEVMLSDGTWEPVEDGVMDTSQAYYVRTSAGPFPVFFYHPKLAAEISFQHLLHSSENLAKRLAVVARDHSMINIATDGEVYGHHEPFGDMCLSHFFDKAAQGNASIHDRFYITNYAAYLEDHPPVLEARLQPGGSSWSCAHGVERWRDNCGCRTDHSRPAAQTWRAPLRDSLNFLRDTVRKVFETEGEKHFTDPFAARNAYIDVILADFSEDERKRFAGEWFRSPAGRTGWRLLEAQRNAMLMFTSCGWFFDDINGIEPRQVLNYAGRVIDLMKPFIKPDVETKFLAILEKAPSRDDHAGSGADIYRRIVAENAAAPLRLVNHSVFSRVRGIRKHYSSRYRIHHAREAFWKIPVDQESSMFVEGYSRSEAEDEDYGRGLTKVTDLRTEEETRYAWVSRLSSPLPKTLIFEAGERLRWPGGDPRDKDWNTIVESMSRKAGLRQLGLADLFYSEAKAYLYRESERAGDDIDVHIRSSLYQLESLLLQVKELGILPEPELTALLSSMNEFIWSKYVKKGMYDAARRQEEFSDKLGLPIPKMTMSLLLSRDLDIQAKSLREEGCLGVAFVRFSSALRSAQALGISLDARVAQEVVYDLLRSEGSAMVGSILAGDGRQELLDRLSELIDTADRLFIDVTEAKMMLEECRGKTQGATEA